MALETRDESRAQLTAAAFALGVAEGLREAVGILEAMGLVSDTDIAADLVRRRHKQAKALTENERRP